MFNKKVIDFIKEESKKGIDKDTIFKQLMVHGWTFKDIQEGFDYLDSNLSKNSKGKIFKYIFLTLFIIFLFSLLIILVFWVTK